MSDEGAGAGPVKDGGEGAEAAGAAPSFEESIRRLGDIVQQLEGGDLPLEKSLGLFEEGIQLARRSQARLDAAEKRVEELLAVDDDGTPSVRELPAEEP